MNQNTFRTCAALLAVALAGCAGSGQAAGKTPGGKTAAGSGTGTGVTEMLKSGLADGVAKPGAAPSLAILKIVNNTSDAVLTYANDVAMTGWVSGHTTQTVTLQPGYYVLKAVASDGRSTTAAGTLAGGGESTWTIFYQ